MSDRPAVVPDLPADGDVDGRPGPVRPPLHRGFLERALVMGPRPAWRALEIVDETGSTNADLAARARAGEPEGLVLVADHQNAGRGRLTRSWLAPPRSSLAMSVLLRPRVDPRYWSWLPLLAGLAVVDALRGTCGLSAVLKWPNDVLVPSGPLRGGAGCGGSAQIVSGTHVAQGESAVQGGQVLPGTRGVPGVPGEAPADGDPADLVKVCGVLAEMVLPGPTATGPGAAGPAVVVGAGVNVDQTGQELPVPTAGSLLTAGAAVTDRNVVLRDCLLALAARCATWQDCAGDPRRSGLQEDFLEHCATLGRRVVVQANGAAPLSGTAEGVDEEGRLLVTDDAGELHVLAAGDVVHVRGPAAPKGAHGLV